MSALHCLLCNKGKKKGNIKVLTHLHAGVSCHRTWLGYEDPGGTEKIPQTNNIDVVDGEIVGGELGKEVVLCRCFLAS